MILAEIVSLTPVWDAVQPVVVTVAATATTAIVGWLLAELKAKWNIDVDQAHRDALQTALTNAAGFVWAKTRATVPDHFDVKSPLVAEGIRYVIASAPGALAHFGLTSDQIATKLVAKLGVQAATGTPAPKPPTSVA